MIGLGDLANQRAQNPDRVCADGGGNGQKLKDVEPAFTALVFGNEGLRLFQPFGEVDLGEAGAFSGLDHQRTKGGLIGGMDGFCDLAGPGCHRGRKMIPDSDYPKRG